MMKRIGLYLLLVLPVAAAERVSMNDGWRFARFGKQADLSVVPEPGKWVAIRASSEEAAKGNVAANAMDGNPETRWCASSGEPGQVVDVDLGRVSEVAVVKLVWEKDGGLPVVVEVSPDGRVWQKVANAGRASEGTKTQRVNLPTSLAKLRHLRLTVNGTTESNWASFSEIELLDGKGMAVRPTAPEKVAAAPSDVAYDDRGWREVSIPHDWGIEGPFHRQLPGVTGKLPWVGIGWYRKEFTLPPESKEKRFYLDVDGAMSDARVFLNGEEVGRWPYGYSAFRVDLGDGVKVGETNVLAIRLENRQESSRWYPGAGIYRNLWLVEKPSVQHIRHNGVFVRTPKVTPGQAIVRVVAELTGGDCPAGYGLRQEILDEQGEVLLSKEGQGGEGVFVLRNPRLWHLEDPYRYQMRVSFTHGGKVLDQETVWFGVRSIEFDAKEGFSLNGKRVYLKGVCMHHDLGPLGAAFHEQAAERQIRILKEMGCNSIRTSHNPPAPEFVELCDRMGVLLQIEAFDTWDKAKRSNDYARFFDEWHERDLRLMVRNFRNHPAVVMWSIGNEIPGGYQNQPDGWKMADKLRTIVKSEDPTRPVTMGNNSPNAGDHLWKGIDLLGFNYKPQLYEKFQKKNTGVPVYGSETASTISSRGEYFFPVTIDKAGGRADFQMSSYDYYAPPWAQRPDIEFAAQDASQPWNFGEYVWTGFDYLGEPTPYNKDVSNLLNFQDPKEKARMKAELDALGKITPPSRSSYFGILDLCGFPKDRFYLYQSRWRPSMPVAHLLPHWNWPERVGEVTPVHVYTSGDEAELFLNGKSLGRKRKDGYRIVWDEVNYQPGELRVVAYKNGKEWARNERSTTGKPSQLLVEREEGEGDLVFLTVKVRDESGRMVPRSKPELRFEVSGDAEILAAGNGDATSLVTMHRATSMPAYNGLCQVILKRTGVGEVGFRASSEGLKDGVWASE